MPSYKTFLLLLACSQLSTAAAINGNAFTGGLIERDGCSDKKLSIADELCYTYCDTQTSQINGAPIKASDRVICNTDSCSDAHADSVTVTETFTVVAGLSTDPITATGSFSWSKSVASSDTYTFTLKNGDDGHLEFIPLLNQVCGTLTSYGTYFTLYGEWCESSVDKTDTNACGTSSAKLNDGTADGTFTFCNTNGTGCNPIQSVGAGK